MSQACFTIEIPSLNVALEGFSPEQKIQLDAWLDEVKSAQDPGAVRWSTTNSLSGADLVLQAQHCHGNTSARHLRTAVFRWPNDRSDAESLAIAKQRFIALLIEQELPLQMNCLQYVLASQLLERYAAKDKLSGLWHVSAAGVLLAVVDFNRLQVSFRPDAHYLEFEEAVWEHRSPHAQAPKFFVAYSLELMVWDYMRRTSRNFLPMHLLHRPLYLRRMPRIPMAYMSEQELTAVMALKERSLTQQELGQSLGWSSLQTKKLLNTLYFNGAVTTRPLKWWQKLALSLGVNNNRLFRDTESSLHNKDRDYEHSTVFVFENLKK